MYKKICSSLAITLVTVGLVTPLSTYAKEDLISESVPSATVNDKDDTQQALAKLPSSKNVQHLHKDYHVANSEKDHLGYTHYTLYPKKDNKFATDKEVKIHVNSQGKVVLINGELDAKKVQPTNQMTLSQDEAINHAFNSIDVERSEASNGQDNVVKSVKSVIDGDKNKYVYEVELIMLTPHAAHWKINVDAQTGNIVKKENMMHTAATQGEGKGVLNDRKRININSISGGYSLEDLTHTGRLSAYDFNAQTGQTPLFTDKDRTFDSDRQKAGVDANYYAANVYDYYQQTFGRNSYDNHGSPINSIAHVNNFQGEDNRNNAAWIGDKMIYGDGDGRTFIELSGANDIVAHEITHGVTQETANLVYQDQPGALNESFSDVFGYFVDDNDWLMGEDVYTPGQKGDALRSMSHPSYYNQPEHMNNYVKTNSDNGGVHTNSGIPNKAAYLTINKIGKQQAQQIYYRALTQYLTSTADFSDARNALIQSAYDLYGRNTAEQISTAWQQVGVTK